MGTIEKKVFDELEILKKRHSKDALVIEYEKTNKIFDKLVEDGYVKKRGNNLLSPADTHIKSKVRFNVKFQA